MRLVIQRVKKGSVTLPPALIPTSSINRGIVALVGIHKDDDILDLKYCCKKLCASKLWSSEDGKPWRYSVSKMNYEILLVSQFTLYGSVTNKKHQPDYKNSMKNIQALELYNSFKEMVVVELGGESERHRVKDGCFGELMDVELVNDGPVTLVVDSPAKEVKEEVKKIVEKDVILEKVVDVVLEKVVDGGGVAAGEIKEEGNVADLPPPMPPIEDLKLGEIT